jgi:hypothetical protein
VLEERNHDPIAHADGDTAVIWGAYDFRTGGGIPQTATNIADLARLDGRWLISGVSNTPRRPAASTA